jgi:hypothetical protein
MHGTGAGQEVDERVVPRPPDHTMADHLEGALAVGPQPQEATTHQACELPRPARIADDGVGGTLGGHDP